jgi:endoglycosylceramidase
MLGPALFWVGAALDAVRWSPAIQQFVDSHGRARVFHGVNAVSKEWPWYPPRQGFDTSSTLSEQDMALMRSWGFNVLRLGVMWPGVEPEKGKVDQAYLDVMESITTDAAKYGIYTLLDAHQDVGSRRFCGEGFPEYYVDEMLANASSAMAKAAAFPFPVHSDPFPVNASGMPYITDCLRENFGDFYGSAKVGAMFAELYRNGTQFNQGFHRYWAAVVGRFAKQPQVLGYELLNEPPGQCLLGDPHCRETDRSPLKYDAWTEESFLAPLYRSLAKVVRAADPDTPIFYEATLYPRVGVTLHEDAFDAPPLGNDTQQVLAYHIYCADLSFEHMDKMLCEQTHGLYYREYFGFVKKHKVGGFISEFGAMDQRAEQLDLAAEILDWADSNFQSWAYWQLKFYDDFTTKNKEESFWDTNGTLEVKKLRTLSRTYAQAIAGVPISMNFNANTAQFDLAFRPLALGAPTEIYLNEELHYKDGYDLTITPTNCSDAFNKTTQKNFIYLDIKADKAGACGDHVEVQIVKKKTAIFV